jgi:hypothetical protein
MKIQKKVPLVLAAVVAVAGLVTACAPQAGASSSEPAADTSSATSAETTPTASPADAVSPSGILDVALGDPFEDAIARTGASITESCEWQATSFGYEGVPDFQLAFLRPNPVDDPAMPVNLVAVTVPVGNVPEGTTVGPVTSEGVGIGSTVDEVLAAYPDAEDFGVEGDPRRHLLVETGEETDFGTESLYLSYTEGTPTIWGMTATTLDTPLYDACA